MPYDVLENSSLRFLQRLDVEAGVNTPIVLAWVARKRRQRATCGRMEPQICDLRRTQTPDSSRGGHTLEHGAYQQPLREAPSRIQDPFDHVHAQINSVGTSLYRLTPL